MKIDIATFLLFVCFIGSVQSLAELRRRFAEIINSPGFPYPPQDAFSSNNPNNMIQGFSQHSQNPVDRLQDVAGPNTAHTGVPSWVNMGQTPSWANVNLNQQGTPPSWANLNFNQQGTPPSGLQVQQPVDNWKNTNRNFEGLQNSPLPRSSMGFRHLPMVRVTPPRRRIGSLDVGLPSSSSTSPHSAPGSFLTNTGGPFSAVPDSSRRGRTTQADLIRQGQMAPESLRQLDNMHFNAPSQNNRAAFNPAHFLTNDGTSSASLRRFTPDGQSVNNPLNSPINDFSFLDGLTFQ